MKSYFFKQFSIKYFRFKKIKFSKVKKEKKRLKMTSLEDRFKALVEIVQNLPKDGMNIKIYFIICLITS